MTKNKLALMTAFGVGLLALPFAMPSTAQADDFRISLNLGGAPYYQPVYQPVYRPAPVHVTYYRPVPQRVVYVNRPVYRERVVYNRGWNNGWHGRGHDQGHGNGQANNHGGWNNHDRNVAWR